MLLSGAFHDTQLRVAGDGRALLDTPPRSDAHYAELSRLYWALIKLRIPWQCEARVTVLRRSETQWTLLLRESEPLKPDEVRGVLATNGPVRYAVLRHALPWDRATLWRINATLLYSSRSRFRVSKSRAAAMTLRPSVGWSRSSSTSSRTAAARESSLRSMRRTCATAPGCTMCIVDALS